MIRSARRHLHTIPVVALTAALVTTATAVATPANADPTNDAFLNALNNAGVNYDDPNQAVQLGQSLCPALAQPGGSLASSAATVNGQNGISAAMAGLFTSIAISMYCPSMVNSFANGDFSNLPQIPGVPGF